MIIELAEHGAALPDHQVEDFVKENITHRRNICLSNELGMVVARSLLFQMRKEERPEVEWIFYGKKVHFDESLRSGDAWDHWESTLDKHLNALFFSES